MSGTTAELSLNALVCAQREGGGRYYGHFYCDGLKESQEIIEIGSDGVYLLILCGLSAFLLVCFLLSSPNSYLYFPVLFGVLTAASDLNSTILAAKILRSSAAEVLLCSTTASVRNGGRRTEFINHQSLIFFDRARLPTAGQTRTYMTSRRIFLPALVKMRPASMETTVGGSRDT